MKKVCCVLAAVAVAMAFVFSSGCTPQQIQTVATQAGIASIVTWIGVDNPTDAQKATAGQVVSVIKSNTTVIAQGGSYYVALYPVITEYINKHVPEQSRAIAILAGGWVLTGIDTFFAMYPKYMSDSEQAAKIVGSFCDGVLIGLSMSRDNPVIQAATRGSTDQVKARKTLAVK